MLVQRAGLVRIGQPGLVLCYSVGQFMADDVERHREAVEQLAVAVAVHHLPAVPECVLEPPAVVHGGVDAQSLAVDGVTLEDASEEVVRLPGAVKGLVDFDVAADDRRLLAQHQLPGKGLLVLRVEDVASFRRERRGGLLPGAVAPMGEDLHLYQCFGRARFAVGVGLPPLLGDVPEDMRWNDMTYSVLL